MAESSGNWSYRDGVSAALPLSVAVFGFGVSYGVLALSVGMGTLAPVVMSATTFAGSHSSRPPPCSARADLLRPRSSPRSC